MGITLFPIDAYIIAPSHLPLTLPPYLFRQTIPEQMGPRQHQRLHFVAFMVVLLALPFYGCGADNEPAGEIESTGEAQEVVEAEEQSASPISGGPTITPGNLSEVLERLDPIDRGRVMSLMTMLHWKETGECLAFNDIDGVSEAAQMRFISELRGKTAEEALEHAEEVAEEFDPVCGAYY